MSSSGGGVSSYIGSKWATILAVVAVAGGVAVIPAVTGGGGTTITCNQTAANSAGLTSALSAASNGQTICLTQAVNYGTFTGTTKNVTIIAQSGSGAASPVDATMAVSLGSGDTGTVVIDGGMASWNSSAGLNIPTGDFTTGAANVTLKNFEIDGTGGSGRRWQMDPAPQNGNILIDHFYAHDVLGGEALFYIDDVAAAGANDTGVTIQRGLFKHFSNDGVKLTGNDTVRVLNNKFMDFHESNSGDGNHTDDLQWLEPNHVIKGNWFSDGDQCLFGDDGAGNHTITHNVVIGCGQHFITLGGDGPTGSVVKDNTIVNKTVDLAPYFQCGNNALQNGFGDTLAQSVTSITDNVLWQEVLAGSGGGLSCVPTANHHNLLKVGESTTGTGGSNFTASSVSYVGGSNPDLFDEFSDFCLAAGSAGLTAASDGGQVGVCGGDWNGSNYGPPSGEGF